MYTRTGNIDRKEFIRRKNLQMEMQEEEERLHRMAVQRKTEIDAPDSVHEQQADEIGKKVANNQNASDLVKNQSTLNSTPQTKSESHVPEVTADIQTKLDSTKGGGKNLDENTKSSMEQNMGVDLSGVKIHTDSKANELSESINAKAFTHEQDIYFKQGNYNPESQSGKELLGHELAHTVQQGRNGVNRKIQREVDYMLEEPKDDGTTIEEKKKWLKRKLKDRWLFGFIPLRYFVKKKIALKAYYYLKKIGPAAREEFFAEYPEEIAMMIQSLPAEVFDAGNFGFSPGNEHENKRTTDLLSEKENWKNPSFTYLLLLDLYQQNRVAEAEKLIADNKDGLLLMLDSADFWRGDESDVIDNIKILVLGGYGANAKPKVDANYNSASFSLKQKLDNIDYQKPSTTIPVKKSNTLLKLATGYHRARKKVKKEFYDKRRNDIETIKNTSGITNSEKREKIKDYKKNQGKFKDQFASIVGLLAHFMGGKGQANMVGLDIMELQKGMGDQMFGYGIVFSDDQVQGKKAGILNYQADLEKGSVLITAQALPFKSINYAGANYNFRTEDGLFDGVKLSYKWQGRGTKGQTPPDENLPGQIELNLDSLEFNNLRIQFTDILEKGAKTKDYTYAIGRIKVKGLFLHIEQMFGPAELLGNGMEFFGRTSTVLMNAMQLLTYAIQRSINRFTPSTGATAGEELKSIMASEFNDNFLEILNYESLEIDDVYLTDYGSIESIRTNETAISVNSVDNNVPAHILAAKKELAILEALGVEKLRKRKNQGKVERIKVLKKQLTDYYAEKEYDLDMTVKNMSITNRDLFQNSLSSPVGTGVGTTYQAGAVGPVELGQMSFSTRFSSQKLSDTSVILKDLVIDKLALSKIRVSDGVSLIDGDNGIELSNLAADIVIYFQNEPQTDEEKKSAGLIKRVEIPYLRADKILVHGFHYINHETLTSVSMPPTDPVVINCLSVENVAYNAIFNSESDTYELKPEILDKSMPATIDIAGNQASDEKGITIPGAINYMNTNLQGRTLLNFITEDISASSIHVDVFDDGTQKFSFKDLAGGAYIKGSAKDEPETSYETHINVNSKTLEGKKKDNELTLFSPELPSVVFDHVSYKTSDTLFRTNPSGKVSLTGIKATGDVIFEMIEDEKDPRPFKKLEIPELSVNYISADSLELYMSPKEGEALAAIPDTTNSTYLIVEPGMGSVSVNNLKLLPFCVYNEIDHTDVTKYNTFFEGSATVGQEKQPGKNKTQQGNTPGLQAGNVMFGTQRSDPGLYMSNSLNFLDLGYAKLDFSLVQAPKSKNNLGYKQKTAFTIQDLKGSGKVWQAQDNPILNNNNEVVSNESTSFSTNFNINLQSLKGSYEEDKLIIDELIIPASSFTELTYGSPSMSMYFSAINPTDMLKIQNVVGSNIQVDFDESGDASKIKIGSLKIAKVSGIGTLNISMGDYTSSGYQDLTFPPDMLTTINNIAITDWVMTPDKNEEGESTWNIHKGSKASVGPVIIPPGLTLKIDNEVRLNMNKISSDLISFESLGRGNFKYSALNLDLSGKYNSELYSDTEIEANFGMDSKELSGEYLKGYDQLEGRRFVEYKINTINIPQITSNQFHFKDIVNSLSIDTPLQPQQPSFIQGITGDFSLKQFLPTPGEKKQQQLDGTVPVLKKILKCNTMRATQISVYGLQIEYNQITKGFDNMTIVSNMLYQIKLPADKAASMYGMELKNFEIVLSGVEGEDPLMKGTAVAGKNTGFGANQLAVDIPEAQIYVQDNMENFFLKTNTSLLVDTITFQGKGKGFDITIDQTSGQWVPWPNKLIFPFSLLPPVSGAQFGDLNNEGESGYAKAGVMDQFFHAEKITISKNEKGDMEYRITNPIIPTLHDVYYSFGKEENIKPGEIESISMTIGGKLDGTFVIKPLTVGDENITTMEVDGGGSIFAEVPEIEIQYKHKPPAQGEYENDLSALPKYNEEKEKEKEEKGSNSFDFLDGLVPGGKITVTFILNEIGSNGEIIEESRRPVELEVYDVGTEHGFFNLRKLILGAATYFDYDLDSQVDGYWAARALSSLNTDVTGDNLVLESMLYQNTDLILVPDVQKNVKSTPEGQMVRLSAFAHYLANKPALKGGKGSGFAANVGAAALDNVHNFMNNVIMDLEVSIDNVEIDLSTIPIGHRGMLDQFIAADTGKVAINAGIKYDHGTYNQTATDVAEKVWQTDKMGMNISLGSVNDTQKQIKIPEFKFEKTDEEKGSSFTLSGNSIKTKAANIQYEDFHMEKMKIAVPDPIEIEALKFVTKSKKK